MTAAATLPRYSASWGESLDAQKSALRWDIKRTIKSLCKKLSDIGEECYIITANASNGWVSQIGSVRGDEYLEDKPNLPYDFLSYCQDAASDNSSVETMTTTDSSSEEEMGVSPKKQKRTRKKSTVSREGKRGRKTSPQSESDEDTESGSEIDEDWSPAAGKQGNGTILERSKGPLRRFNRVAQPVPRHSKHSRTLHCSTCSRSFKHRELFIAHLQDEQHRKKTSLVCHKCFKVFPNRASLNIHLQTCPPEPDEPEKDPAAVRKERRKGIPRKVVT